MPELVITEVGYGSVCNALDNQFDMQFDVRGIDSESYIYVCDLSEILQEPTAEYRKIVSRNGFLGRVLGQCVH